MTVIENVPPAQKVGPMRADLTLNGPMFGLMEIERARIFEISWPVAPVKAGRIHRDHPPMPITTHLSLGDKQWRRWRERIPDLKSNITVAEARRGMGIETEMTGNQVGQAIPPAMAEYIGRLALRHIGGQ